MCRYRSKPTAVNALHFTSTALQWELAELCSQLSAARKYHTHAHIAHICRCWPRPYQDSQWQNIRTSYTYKYNTHTHEIMAFVPHEQFCFCCGSSMAPELSHVRFVAFSKLVLFAGLWVLGERAESDDVPIARRISIRNKQATECCYTLSRSPFRFAKFGHKWMAGRSNRTEL